MVWHVFGVQLELCSSLTIYPVDIVLCITRIVTNTLELIICSVDIVRAKLYYVFFINYYFMLGFSISFSVNSGNFNNHVQIFVSQRLK